MRRVVAVSSWVPPRRHSGEVRKKKSRCHSAAPTHPSRCHISYGSLARRIGKGGDGSRRDHLRGVSAAAAGEPRGRRGRIPHLQVGRLWGDFRPGIATPCRPKQSHSGPLSSPSSRRPFQVFRFADFRSVLQIISVRSRRRAVRCQVREHKVSTPDIRVRFGKFGSSSVSITR